MSPILNKRTEKNDFIGMDNNIDNNKGRPVELDSPFVFITIQMLFLLAYEEVNNLVHLL